MGNSPEIDLFMNRSAVTGRPTLCQLYLISCANSETNGDSCGEKRFKPGGGSIGLHFCRVWSSFCMLLLCAHVIWKQEVRLVSDVLFSAGHRGCGRAGVVGQKQDRKTCAHVCTLTLDDLTVLNRQILYRR